MRALAGIIVAAAAIVWAQSAPSRQLSASLLSAAEKGNATEVRSLLRRGASPNSANSDGNSLTALMLAARGGHTQVVRLLLQAGATVEATAAVPVGASGMNEDLTALMEAVASGNAATVELLLSHKANPDARAIYEVIDSTGTKHMEGCRPAIMHAINFAVLRLLAEHGANLLVKDCDGNSVLMFAAEHLDSATVQYLLRRGLNPRERNNKGMTALDLARQAAKTANIEVLDNIPH